jgi:hypothetical protein
LAGKRSAPSRARKPQPSRRRPTKAGDPVAEHSFKVGQKVRLNQSLLSFKPLDGVYEIVRLLPPDGPYAQYRVKSMSGFQERVVREIEIILS